MWQIVLELMGGCMQAIKVSAAVAAVIVSAVAAFTTAPSQAQTAAPEVRPGPVRAAVVVHPPARVTVRKRSYLDPGTETKRRAEHFQAYPSPSLEQSFAPFRGFQMFKNRPPPPVFSGRMPVPAWLRFAAV